jgi:hypothetical protein
VKCISQTAVTFTTRCKEQLRSLKNGSGKHALNSGHSFHKVANFSWNTWIPKRHTIQWQTQSFPIRCFRPQVDYWTYVTSCYIALPLFLIKYTSHSGSSHKELNMHIQNLYQITNKWTHNFCMLIFKICLMTKASLFQLFPFWDNIVPPLDHGKLYTSNSLIQKFRKKHKISTLLNNPPPSSVSNINLVENHWSHHPAATWILWTDVRITS